MTISENLNSIGNNQINKHYKYRNYYGDNNIYWGLGIENEIYLEFENKFIINKIDFLSKHSRERYSVDYFTSYKKEYINNMLTNYFNFNSIDGNILEIPIILNSHNFTDTDIYNNPKKLYTVKNESNPKFCGKTLIKILESNDSYFIQNDKWLFDGDLLEFTTLNFYCSKLSDVITELKDYMDEFIFHLNDNFSKLNICRDYGKINFMSKNHPITTHLTNLGNVGIFNNGTIHFNLTLPTKMSMGQIENKENFIDLHKKAIKIIQWFEPIIISIYGSADPFYNFLCNKNINISNSSQRCVLSRYISIGTYDTDLMETGKILTKKINDMDFTKNYFWWYNRFHNSSVYNKLEEIGYDINFNKHWNHGIELRIFDHINNYNDMHKCFEFIIHLCDIVLNNDIDMINPIKDKLWNNIVYNCLTDGKNYILEEDEKVMYEMILGFKIRSNKISEFYDEIYFKFTKNRGPFSLLVL
jgi:hypothetical protein